MLFKDPNETVNDSLSTGEIEVKIDNYKLLSKSEVLPLPVNSDIEYGEEVRLKTHFLICVEINFTKTYY